MKLSAFLLILLFAAPVLAQDNEKINWNQDRPLSWSDFKASPKRHLPYKANTNSGLSFAWNSTESNSGLEMNYEVGSNFYPKRSWVKEIEEVNYLLAHEQLHFDITELHARKLRKTLESYEPGEKIKKDLSAIYSEIENQRLQMQRRFDKETDHSINKEAEFKWRQFIKQELNKFSEYSS